MNSKQATAPKVSRQRIAFAAINQFEESNIILPTEKEVTGKDMVEWGTRNLYPNYLLSLYDNVPTLRSIVNGNVDFITGDDVILNVQTPYGGKMNKRGDTIREQVRDVSHDYEIHGGYALQIIRGRDGRPAEVYYIDMRFLRSNKENTVFYYCEEWEKGGNRDVIVFPAFLPDLKWESLSDEERARHASSILFVKNTRTQVYPAPLYAAAVKDCEIEKNIADFHLNSIANGFAPSVIVNFNNGQPTDEVADQIEEEFNEKFSGSANGGRAMLSWNKSKDNATTFEYPKVEDFGARYEALSKHSRQQIFSSFRAIPLLFGLTSETNTGFSTDEFEQSFKLYNRTQIRPVQRTICDTYDRIFGVQGALTIRPFSIEADNETSVN